MQAAWRDYHVASIQNKLDTIRASNASSQFNTDCGGWHFLLE